MLVFLPMKVLKRLLIICFFPILVGACSGLKISSDRIQPMGQNFSGSFFNIPDDSIQTYTSPTFIQLFNIYRSVGDTVQLGFIDSTHLRVTFVDSSLNQGSNQRSITWEGKFSKEGYFEIYLRNEKKEFPPVVPILFRRRNMDRVRLAFTKEGFLFIEKYKMTGGSVLIIAQYKRTKYDRFFKSI